MLNWHFHVNCWADLPVLWVLVQNLGQWKPGNRQDSAGINCQFNRDYQIPCSVLLSRHKTIVFIVASKGISVYDCAPASSSFYCFSAAAAAAAPGAPFLECNLAPDVTKEGKQRKRKDQKEGAYDRESFHDLPCFWIPVLWEQHGTVGLPFVCAGTQPAPWQHSSASSMHGSCRLNWVHSVEIQGLTYNSSNQDVQMIMVSKAIPIGNLWDSVFCRNLLSSTHSL